MKRLFMCLGLVTVLAAVICILTVHDFLAITQRVQADILVVEGWTYNYPAMAEAAAEFKRGGYRVVVTVGPPILVGDGSPQHVSVAVLAAEQLQRRGVGKESIVALPLPDGARHRTYMSGLAVKEWLRRSHVSVKGLNVFTIGPHARKSLVLFTRALGTTCAVGVIAGTDSDFLPDRWWMSQRGIYIILRKVAGYLYAVIWPLPEEMVVPQTSP